MKFFKVLSLALFLFAVANVPAQKFLQKPYTTWSQSEAKKIINDSGWAKTFRSTASGAAADMRAISRESRNTANNGGGNPGSESRDFGNLPVVIRLHSAPVVRQALIRLEQLNIKYDKMSEAEKAKFDASRKGYLECAICNDYYVVTLTKYTDSSGTSVNEGIFESIKLEDLKGNLALVSDKGDRREVFQFTPAKGASDSSIFFFKRLDDNGKPLLSPESKEFEFIFTNTFIEWDKRYQGLYPHKWEFSVPKITIDGKVIF